MGAAVIQRFIDIIRGKYPLIGALKWGRKYDELCSLGYNCEVAFRLNDLLKTECNHYLFTYSFEHNREKFIECLNNLTDIQNDEYTYQTHGMFYGSKYQISFHPRNKKEDFINKDGSINNQIVKDNLKELLSRIKYLGEKTYKLIHSDKKTLFIIKIKHTNLNEDKEFIEKLYNFFENNYKNTNYKLLCVLGKNNYPANILKYIKKNVNGGKLPHTLQVC